MADSPDVLDLLVRLGAERERAAVAARLARRLGAEGLLVLVRDPDLGALLPAPGFPQTLAGGPAWRSFLTACPRRGRHAGAVDLPRGSSRPALALLDEEAGAVLIGGRPVEAEVAVLERLLPLLGALLAAEQRAVIARAEAVAAHGEMGRAHTLASALERARAESARLNAELREEHRRKDDFLAMLAHELRNPLAPLVSSIELLRRGRLAPQARERQLGLMARQVGLLARLVEDLLDVSRVSRGRIELRRERLAVQQLVTDAVESSRTLIEARRHQIELSLPEGPAWVEGDRFRLTQVFSNLLHNAAKYTDPGGRLTISVRREDDVMAIRVADTGVGIAPDVLPRIFDLFVQAPVSLGRAQGGLGIGLTLSRALVDLHGGSVSVDSAGLGHGSTFTVRLPLAAGAGAAVEVPETRPEPASAATLRVLVVDDNADAADTVRDLIEMVLGQQVEVAYSGPVALQIAPDFDPDLLLLDIGLPEMDGYELARRLRRLVRRDARFVALTGYGSKEDKRRSREAGFDEHLVKPLKLEHLRAMIDRATERPTEASEG